MPLDVTHPNLLSGADETLSLIGKGKNVAPCKFLDSSNHPYELLPVPHEHFPISLSLLSPSDEHFRDLFILEKSLN